MEVEDGPRYSLSFSGCGFLCMYHTGVVAAIKEYAPELARYKVCGASAGAIAAAGIVCNVCVSKAVSTMLQVVTQANRKVLGPLDSSFHLMDLVRQGLDEALPPNAHELCTGVLQISLTRVHDGKNIVVSEYATRDELLDAVLCSCFIPFYCGRSPPLFRGVKYWDGGLSDNQPIIDEHTITVSPFSGESDICPSDVDSASMFDFDFQGTSIRFTSRNLFRIFGCLFPPSLENCSRMCRQGFEDTLRFLTRAGLTPCARCLTIQSNSLPLPKYKTSRARNSSSISLMNRARMGSECDMCFEKVEPKINSAVTTVLFPSIMQKTLDEAAIVEHWLVKYLFKFRMVRYSWRAMLPVFLPLQYIAFGLQRIVKWLASLPETNAMLQRFQKMIGFIVSEIERMHGPLASLTGYFSFSEKKTCAPTSLAIPKPKVETLVTSPDMSGYRTPSLIDDEDSMNRLVQYSGEHDAILAYYYIDERNCPQVCEIFDMERPFRFPTCHPTAKGNQLMNSPVPEVMEVEDEDATMTTVASPPPAEDSGLSLTEDNAGSSTVNKRDACCSPVRQLSTGSCRSSLRSYGSRSTGSGTSGRRAGNVRRTLGPRISDTIPSGCSMDSSSGQAAAAAIRNIFSSDSDPDAGGEMFFVTNRRKRTASDDYDGDPEQSDTDLGS